ncbi:MAG: hypothetical protein ACLPZY_04975 [Terracidiphilus sp.]
MTLLDAPKFDAAREKRNALILRISAVAVFVLLVAWWLVAGRPVDWPWNWNHYMMGRAKVNKFLTAVEANDLASAYGIWLNDKNWQQHPQNYTTYPFARFQDDWSPTSPDNEYGAIKSHQVVLAGRYGNGILVASLINGRKTDALNLEYDPRTGTLSFSPPGTSLYLGP